MFDLMSYYFPGNGPESWQALLADPEKQWKVGRSARTLAHCWEGGSGFPPEVSRVLDESGHQSLSELELVAGFPEHQVPLPGGRRPSQTDVFVLGRNASGLVAIAVEGKVDEPFGPTVKDWLGTDPSRGKRVRLEYLRDMLRIDHDRVGELRYQLLHRTASAAIEAARFGAPTSAMLVHSWAGNQEGFVDYAAFVDALGGEASLDGVSGANVPGLYLGWIRGAQDWLRS